MSVEAFKAGMELRSRSLGRAVLAAGRRRVVIHPEAIGVVTLAMAGERTGLWGIAYGKVRRGTPKISAVGDARDYADQARLWSDMAQIFQTAGDEPQLIVPSRRTARLLAESAARFRYNDSPEVARAAEMAWWCLTRREIAGSHSAVVLTEVLDEHFSIGADAGSNDDLRVWLAWIGATGQEDLAERTARRLAEPLDPKTEVEFDEALWPAVERREEERIKRRALVDQTLTVEKRRRLERDIDRQAKNRATKVKAALTPTLRSGWGRLVETVEIMNKDQRPYLADLEKFCESDQKSWSAEVARRERGFAMSRRDSPRAAVVGIVEAEAALSCWNSALVWDDPMARAEAIAAGRAVVGTIADADASGFTLVSSNETVRARVGDAMNITIASGQIAVEVVDVSDSGGAVSVTVEWSGNRILLDSGSEMTLWPSPPDYGRRFVGWLRGRIKDPHWALGDKNEPITRQSPQTNDNRDPLAAVMALRKTNV